MSQTLIITIIGTLVGVVGTGLGGLIALFIVKPSSRFLGILIGITSGIMLSVVAFDLLPESYEIAGLGTEILGILLGVLTVVIIEGFFPANKKNKTSSNSKVHFFRTGALLGIAIAIHNLPEGLAIGSGYMFTSKMGITMAIIIALHNFPEGLAMAAPLRLSGSSAFRVVLYTILVGIPTGIGAFIGALLGSVSNFFIGLCLAFAGGTMLYITCGEMIPDAKSLHGGRASAIGIVLGFIIGIVVSVSL
ncbi:ZIP family metal transporter [Proteiniborus sp. MB09-C3]|uniref:ZIP family metal transporter n=1 Tax=Proteiniborus sp. MB09-C3 TaxID=3050072 RepID=UPI0025544AF1|nr:ZIP family metal transporter [Proteiniborus sp. MB09-C3]WIV12205.1 ZIP family metal transporter [Proteiniborus sp. MB09-C3]